MISSLFVLVFAGCMERQTVDEEPVEPVDQEPLEDERARPRRETPESPGPFEVPGVDSGENYETP